MQKYRVSGAMFEATGNGPAFTGFVEIDGVKTHIALWPKRSAKGDDYYQVSENKPRQQGQGAATPQQRSPLKPRRSDNDDPFGDGGDSIPF
jgi:hypothetical protein